MTPEEFRAHVDAERRRGRAFVGGQLDDLCHEFGMDPVRTWRLPRAEERWLREQRVALAVRQHAASQVLRPAFPLIVSSVA